MTYLLAATVAAGIVVAGAGPSIPIQVSAPRTESDNCIGVDGLPQRPGAKSTTSSTVSAAPALLSDTEKPSPEKRY